MTPSRASRYPSSTVWRRRHRRASSAAGSRRTRRPARSWRTCSAAEAGSPGPRSTASAGPSRSRPARSTGCSPKSSCVRPTSVTSTPRSGPCPRRPGANRVSRSRSATCSRPAARPVAGRSSSTRSSGRPTTRRTRPAGCDPSPVTTGALSAATSSAARSFARRRSTRTTSSAPGRTSAPTRCATSLLARFPVIDGRGQPSRRTARPAHRAAAGRPRRHPRADRERPPRRAGHGRPAARLARCHPAGEPARDGSGEERRAARVVRPRPAAGRERSSASATRGSPSRRRSGASEGSSSDSTRGRKGPVQARLGEDLRSLGEGAATALRRPVRADGLRGAARRPERLRPHRRDATDPPRPRPAADASESRASRGRLPRDRLGPRPRRRRAAADRRPGRRHRSGSPWSWQASTIETALAGRSPRSPATGASSRSSTAAPEAIIATVLAGPRRGLPVARGPPRRSRGGHRFGRRIRPAPAVACHPARGRARTSGSTRSRAGPATPTSSRAGASSRHRSASTIDRSRPRCDPGRRATAIETLRARGEPASMERLLGEILVESRPSGQLRR